MRLNENQHQRIQLLSAILEEIAVARVELRGQTKELDVREIAARSERNALQNLASPTSDLAAEVLAMIFEAGVRQANDSSDFGVPVSHVSQRWRNVALATPGLWTNIWCAQSDGNGELHRMPIADRVRERAATFLSRTGTLPVDISIFLFRDEDFSPEFLELIGEHMWHCRQLRIKDAALGGRSKALGYLSTKSAPRLSSIDWGCEELALKFYHAPFPLGAPCLTAVQLECPRPSSLHLCAPAFRSVTSMRLTSVEIPDNSAYDQFRECFGAMTSLTHLEVHFEQFIITDLLLRLHIVLPTLHFLLVDFDFPSSIGTFIQAIRAPCVRTLSITAWNKANQLKLLDTMNIGDHFPSLQHLILNGVSKPTRNLDLIARIFPDIERLTCQVVQPSPPSTKNPCRIEHILAAVIPLTRTAEYGGDNDAQISRRWHSLKSIAMSAEKPLNAMALEDMLHKLKGVGHPLRELVLSKAMFSQAGGEAMAQLRQLVEIKEFHVDWPTPFACRACGSRLRLLPPTCRENCIYSDMGGDSRPWESDT